MYYSDNSRTFRLIHAFMQASGVRDGLPAVVAIGDRENEDTELSPWNTFES
jgi:hypothetical protein